ncbi:MAG: type II secretion system F family protein [Maricaulaceae bacterium]
MDPALLIAVSAVGAILGFGWVVSGFVDDSGSKSAKRAIALVEGGVGKARTNRAARAAAEANANRRKQLVESLKDLEQDRKKKRQERKTLEAQIEQAGLQITETQYWVFSGVLFVVGAGVTVLVGQPLIAALAAGLTAGLGLPRFTLNFLAKRRAKLFSENFADAVDVIVRGVRSGLPLNECMRILAKEAAEPVRSEIARLNETTAVGVTIDEGLRRLYERMPLQEVNFFNIVLVIQQKTGGNLAESLSNLSTVLRSRKLMREKIKALSAEAKTSAMIIGAMPIIFVVAISFMSPGFMDPMFESTLGRLMLVGAGVWMVIGTLVMRKMINFDF